MRRAIVIIHRYTGLFMAGFLVIAGLTGTVLVWNDQLDAWLNPALFVVQPPSPQTVTIDPLQLRDGVAAAYPQALVLFVPLQIEPGRTVQFRLFNKPPAPQADRSARPATPTPVLKDDQVFVNPYTGVIQGTRRFDAIDQGRKSVMPFIYRLHYTLALGNFGRYLFGVVALLWLIDCFAGLFLTLPIRRKARNDTKEQMSWWTRWCPAWLVRWNGGTFKLTFDLHRASGLWLWLVFLVLAWSSIAFNLNAYYDPVKRALFTLQPGVTQHAVLASSASTMGWSDARDTGRHLMQEVAANRKLVVQREESFFYNPVRAEYRYTVRTDRDIRPRGTTSVTFDARSGALRRTWIPTGEASGDTVDIWIKSLHKAEVQTWQVMVQIVVALSGLACALLSVTGIAIWFRKRRSRMTAR